MAVEGERQVNGLRRMWFFPMPLNQLSPKPCILIENKALPDRVAPPAAAAQLGRTVKTPQPSAPHRKKRLG